MRVSGGLASCDADLETDFEAPVAFLKGYKEPGSGLPPLWSATARGRFAEPTGCWERCYPPGHVFTTRGGTRAHVAKLWDEVLDKGRPGLKPQAESVSPCGRQPPPFPGWVGGLLAREAIRSKAWGF